MWGSYASPYLNIMCVPLKFCYVRLKISLIALNPAPTPLKIAAPALKQEHNLCPAEDLVFCAKDLAHSAKSSADSATDCSPRDEARSHRAEPRAIHTRT